MGDKVDSEAANAEIGTAPAAELIGHSTNLVGLSTTFLADVAFNAKPVATHISGVREMNGGLFEMLDLAADLAEAGEAFHSYMMAMFAIDIEQREPKAAAGKRRFRSSYLRLIKGWGYDSNGPEGAVLKGWVESRFGIFPTFHKAPIRQISSRTWTTYVEEKMSSRFHNNAIYVQLDLLYEFCQWAFGRFVAPGASHLTLYRGVNSFEEHQIIERIDKHNVLLRLNNLTSFSSDRDIAGCFGDTILTAKIPVQKVAFFNTLLATHPLKGESEYLVIGGECRVHASYF